MEPARDGSRVSPRNGSVTNVQVRWRTEACQGPELNDWIVKLTQLANSRCPVYRPSKDTISFCKYFYGKWRPTGSKWYDLFVHYRDRHTVPSWDIEYEHPMP